MHISCFGTVNCVGVFSLYKVPTTSAFKPYNVHGGVTDQPMQGYTNYDIKWYSCAIVNVSRVLCNVMCLHAYFLLRVHESTL